MPRENISRYKCGHPYAATIAIVEGEGAGEVWEFQGYVSIGRHRLNRLDFPSDETLGERHASLIFDLTRWYIEPEAGCHVFLDGVQVGDGETLIPSGSTVRCGRQLFRIIYRQEGDPPRRSVHAEFWSERKDSAMAATSDALAQALKKR